MNGGANKLKNQLYYYFVEKNWGVRREYGPYVDGHQQEHQRTPWKHWWLLIQLNWHYRILRADSYFLKKGELSRNNAASQSTPKIVPFSKSEESGKRNWPDSYRLAQSLLKYDVISFDIFDTLLLRRLNNPTDLFSILGGKLNCIDFYEVRRLAEQEARKIKLETCGTREVTLHEIYQRVSYYTGIDSEQGARMELELECDICYANPYLHRVYRMLKVMGRRVIATSDMYIPKEQMEILLKHCGYDELDEIFVSCDYFCNKVDGGLFEKVKTFCGEKISIIHIGDNFKGDVQGARDQGLEARHYAACKSLGNPHRCGGMSPLIESAYRALVNNALHNGIERRSYTWEYGFTYGGLATLGYVQWLHRQATEKGLEKLLFTARDGFIFKKVYDLCFQDIPSEYVYWSRSAAIRSINQEERYYFLDHFLQRRKDKTESLMDALEICGLSGIADIFTVQGINLDQEITDKNLEHFRDITVANWERVVLCLAPVQAVTGAYLKKIVGGAERVGIVDLGFTGKNDKLLKDILVAQGMDERKIELYLMGNVLMQQNADLILGGRLNAYLFDMTSRPAVRNEVVNGGELGCGLFEKMYGAPHPSFLGFSADGTMEFAPMESENNPKLVELQSGILDFCKQYLENFLTYPEFFNISSNDAYAPLGLLIKNQWFILKTMGDLQHAVRVSLKDATSIASKK